MILTGDCCAILPTLAADSFDSVVTDPPYGLEFMGKEWDHGIPGIEFWQAVLRVLKPGGYMLAMGGTRTYHRLTCAVEDAGFEIRDCLMWMYGTGFPKGQGCLKPAWEPILLARKPGKRVLPLSIDACRVGTEALSSHGGGRNDVARVYGGGRGIPAIERGSNPRVGRYPANVVHDGGDEVLEAFAAFGEKTSGKVAAGGHKRSAGTTGEIHGGGRGLFPSAGDAWTLYGDTGTAARFFYCAKASKAERAGSKHPTVKPLALMRWLVRLVTPEGGSVLDPFAGSGTTLEAAALEGREAVGIEQDAAYVADIHKRLERAKQASGLFAEAV